MLANRATMLLLLVIVSIYSSAQSPAISQEDTYSLPNKYLDKVDHSLNELQQRLDRKTENYLKKLERQEAKIYRKLWKKDSVAAKELIGDAKQRYASLKEDASRQAGQLSKFSQVYSGKLDSLGTALRFLENTGAISPQLKQQISNASQSINGLQHKLNQTDLVRKYLKERKQFLSTQLEKFGLATKLKRYNKQFYYYQQQLAEYKSLLNDPAGLGKKLLGIVSELPAFRNFFAKYSQLGSLFNLPGSLNTDPASLAGLQLRAAVTQNLQSRLGASPAVQQAWQQNMQSAQDQLNELKNKINQHFPQGGGSDEEMPSFKPNQQKTKSFWRRLEWGTNFQSQRPNNYFPVTSDIGLSLGYKLNDKSTLGVGTSYKIGWGQNIRNINITHQGVGLRSFADINLKGSFWISGGYEMNYRSRFNSIDALRNFSAWQQSGLIGMSKLVSMNNKFFKKTKVQLLWDFLSYQQTPRTQAIVFRIGYNIK